MKVKIANRTWTMGRKEYQGLLRVASEQVPFGIYAVEKKDYAELLNIRCQSVTQLKRRIREFKGQGFKVHENGKA
ncbi:hypothetical protein D3Z38_18255 [Clostridiales bacterium]|nr:hypothetical protein [Clostridiales bacterium]